MKQAWREAQVCVDRGKTRKKALDGALNGMNGFLLGAGPFIKYESMTAQYEELPEEEGYRCTLTLFYTREQV